MAPAPGCSTCGGSDDRRHDVATGSTVNGLDFVEVDPGDQRVLLVGLLHPLPGQAGGVPSGPALTAGNVLVEGGTRVTGIEVLSVAAVGRLLTVTTDVPGDFSTYVLRLVRSAVDSRPPIGIDPALSARAFSFKAGCPSDLDCASERPVAEPVLPDPHLDHLAKDYASLRRLLLDRIAELSPGATDGGPADPLVTVVEALAHVGDRLSYQQDAVAAEAYLGTARSRISVRRHARLLDYAVHDGAAARTWLRVEVRAGTATELSGLPAGTVVLSGGTGDVVLAPEDVPRAVADGAVAFELLEDLAPLAARNEIAIHPWGSRSCSLPAGSTCMSLVDDPPLQLAAGDVLVLEQVAGPLTGRAADADPLARWAVRLVEITPAEDPVEGVPLVDVRWGDADALPFLLPVRAVVPGTGTGTEVVCAVARGNVVAASHGLRRRSTLPPVSGPRWRPLLTADPVASASPLLSTGPAATALEQDPRRALPVLRLVDDTGAVWEPRRDLLSGDRFDPGVVVEVERDGRALLRFGDDITGRSPARGSVLSAEWLVGGGTAGNVARDVLTRVATPLEGVLRVTNPLPAVSGQDPEDLEHVRQHAPAAFLVQQRAVTEADWREVALRSDLVQDAAARFRWTGSWWTVLLTVDLVGGVRLADDPALADRLRRGLDRYRIAGYDLQLRDPVDVPVELGLHVCVAPDALRVDVAVALAEALSDRDLPGGDRGLFHPDRHTFGQPLYASQVVARAMRVPGVVSVEVTALHQVGRAQGDELVRGVLAVGDVEVVRLDDDPSTPENGVLRLDLEGGL
jgi:hypothetical protein